MSWTPPPAGGLLLDKPPGPTSHDMVARARRALGVRRVGHTGTLDPFASGLLLLLVGPATRLAEYLSELPKQYAAEARLGQRTATHDPEGEVVDETAAWKDLDPERVERALLEFVGPLEQVPPDFSAKKLRGEAAYRKARRGEAVTLAPVHVRIHEMVVEEMALPRVRFRVLCSTGTYVRALARDLGEKLGVGAHLTALRRTRIGPLAVEDALSAEDLEEEVRKNEEPWMRAWRSPLELLAHLPRVEVERDDALRLESGQTLPAGKDAAGGEGPVAVASEGDLVAVGQWEGGRLRPRKVFARD